MVKHNPAYRDGNYVALAKWSWIRLQQPTVCPEVPSLWGALEDSTPEESNALRALLSVNNTEDMNASATRWSPDIIDCEASGQQFIVSNVSEAFNTSGVAYSLAEVSNFTCSSAMLEHTRVVNITWEATSSPGP